MPADSRGGRLSLNLTPLNNFTGLFESSSNMNLQLIFRLTWALIPVIHCMNCVADEPWIIDPHTHFKGPEQIEFESTRVKRDPRNSLGHVVVPENYRAIADRLKIQSTLVVEAVDQDQPQFNDWLLRQAESNLICGYVARGDLASDDFRSNYKRYQKSGYLKGYRFRFDELNGYLSNDAARRKLKAKLKGKLGG